MLTNKDNLANDGQGVSGSETGASQSLAPEKRGRGRPKGSRNRIGRDIKALLERHAPPAIRALCRFAAGHSIKVRDAAGGFRIIAPDAAEMVSAQRIILDKLVASLKATELSGPDGEALVPEKPEPTTRDLAKAVLVTLSQGVGRVSVAGPDEHIARFRDPDLGRQVFPEGAQLPEEGDSASEPVEPDDRIVIDERAALAPHDVLSDGTERYRVLIDGEAVALRSGREAAEAYARELSAA